jgi:hypothetical protein
MAHMISGLIKAVSGNGEVSCVLVWVTALIMPGQVCEGFLSRRRVSDGRW